MGARWYEVAPIKVAKTRSLQLTTFVRRELLCQARRESQESRLGLIVSMGFDIAPLG